MFGFIYVGLFFLVLYFFLIFSFNYGFLNIEEYFYSKKKLPKIEKPLISIIIPVKNEEKNIPNLIKNIKNQTLLPEYYEVIIINDFSKDNTKRLVSELIKPFKNFRLCNLSGNFTGKKYAIIKGVKLSKSDLIVSTDADCFHKPEWLETILNFWFQHKPTMIIAPVKMTGETFFAKFQSLEFLSLVASTSGAVGIKHPIMCNGANLIYEKNIFYADALNNKYFSGDDIFLLHHVKRNPKNKILYLKSKNATVETKAEINFKSFVKQRIRWSSKSSAYKDFDTIASSLIVFGINFLIVIFALSGIFNIFFIKIFLIFLVLKSIPDFIFLVFAGKFFQTNKLLKYFICLFPIYPFYLVFTAFAGFFQKKNYSEK